MYAAYHKINKNIQHCVLQKLFSRHLQNHYNDFILNKLKSKKFFSRRVIFQHCNSSGV